MAWDRNSVLERCAVSAATAWGFYLLARFMNHRWHMTVLQQALEDAQASLEHERVKRKADRVGRIRAEQELRAVKVQLQRLQLHLQLQPQGEAAAAAAVDDVPQGTQPSPAAETGTAEAVRVPAEEDGAAGGTAAAKATSSQAQQEQQHEERGQIAALQGPGGQQRQRAESAAAAVAVALEGRLRPLTVATEGASGTATTAARTAALPVAEYGMEAKRTAAAAAAALAAAGSAMPAFPFWPIGHLQSVFTERNGTPRQPQLVPAARSRLQLSPNVPAACLEGLEQYSHCWVLYVFHANTDLTKYLSADRSGLKAKIHVPRLNGGRMGVLATRSPHRPSPIGLSTAEVIRVEGNSVVLGGADIVDGSPVLDIKPYVPFCDCLTTARAPDWVRAEAADEPLAVRQVVIGEMARAALARAWQARRSHSMYGTAEQYLELVRQVLGRDIRSVHQRLHVRPTAAGPAASAACVPGTHPQHEQQQQQQQLVSGFWGGGGESGSEGCGTSAGEYHVVLENIYVSYDISPSGVVHVYNAWVDPITAR